MPGFHRSRALWDHVRYCKACCSNIQRQHEQNESTIAIHNTTTSTNNTNNNKASYCYYYNALVRAILYEIQPIRYSIVRDSFLSIRKTLQMYMKESKINYTTILPWLISTKTTIIWLIRYYWMYLIGTIVYYIFIRYMHELYDAGPIIMILTALILIFTIGLEDHDKNDVNYVSAYSVFNKGFQKIMGTIDSNELLAQHIGGGAGMMMMNNNNINRVDDDNEDDD